MSLELVETWETSVEHYPRCLRCAGKPDTVRRKQKALLAADLSGKKEMNAVRTFGTSPNFVKTFKLRFSEQLKRPQFWRASLVF